MNTTKYKRQPQRLFYIEVTDVFGGEANYAWVTRHIIRATTQRGAVNKFSRLSGNSWHAVGCDRYDSKSGATCFFIQEYDERDAEPVHGYDTDERPEPRFPADMLKRERETLHGALRIAPNGVAFWDQNAVRVVKQSGEVVARSRNLRGIIDYARRSPVVRVDAEPHTENAFNGFLAVHYADGATACALFADARVMREWVAKRRIFKGAKVYVR